MTLQMKEIPNYTGYYATTDGKIYSKRSGELIQLHGRMRKGYLRVNLISSSPKGKLVTEPIHKLVLETYIGKRPDGYVCRHLNGNSTDNRLENLCWGTQKENIQDSIRHGTAACLRCGENAIAAKLKEKDVIKIRELYKEGYLQRDIASIFFISRRYVSEIVTGKRWSHVKTPGN